MTNQFDTDLQKLVIDAPDLLEEDQLALAKLSELELMLVGGGSGCGNVTFN